MLVIAAIDATGGAAGLEGGFGDQVEIEGNTEVIGPFLDAETQEPIIAQVYEEVGLAFEVGPLFSTVPAA